MNEETRACELDRPFFMIDLEALDTTPTAAVVSIGAVAFNPRKNLILSEFYTDVDFDSCIEIGGTIGPNTLRWWIKQINESSDSSVLADSFNSDVSIQTALNEFSDWLFDQEKDYEKRVIFGNGSDFDNTILAVYYKRLGIPQPWGHWGNRCYRSLKNMYPAIAMQKSNSHHALVDARNQADHLMEIASHAKVKSL